MTAHVANAAFSMGILLPGQAGEGGMTKPEGGDAPSGATPFATLLDSMGLGLPGFAVTEAPATTATSPMGTEGVTVGTPFAAPAAELVVEPGAGLVAEPGADGELDDAVMEALLALPLTVALPAPPPREVATDPAAQTIVAAPALPAPAPISVPVSVPVSEDRVAPSEAALVPVEATTATPVAPAEAAPAAPTPPALPADAKAPAPPPAATVPAAPLPDIAVETGEEPVLPAAPKVADAAPRQDDAATATPVEPDPFPAVPADLFALPRSAGTVPAAAPPTEVQPANDGQDVIVLPVPLGAPRLRATVSVIEEAVEEPAPAPRQGPAFASLLAAQAANDDAPPAPAEAGALPAPAIEEAPPAPQPEAAEIETPDDATAATPVKAGNQNTAAHVSTQATTNARTAAATTAHDAAPVVTTDAPAQPTSLPVSPAAAAASQIAAEAAAGSTTARSLPHPAVDQVTVAIRRALDGGSDRIRVQLWPEHLGRVDVTLRLHDDGRVSAAIAVDRPETLDLFHQESRGLERALEQAGLRTEQGDVSLSLRNGQGQAGYAFSQDQGRNAPQNAGAGDTRLAAAETPDAPAQPRRDASRVVDIHA